MWLAGESQRRRQADAVTEAEVDDVSHGATADLRAV